MLLMKNKFYNEALSVTPSNTISSDDCSSCTLYVILFTVFLTTSVIIGNSFIYFYWYSKKNAQLNPEKNTVRVKFNPHTQTSIY